MSEVESKGHSRRSALLRTGVVVASGAVLAACGTSGGADDKKDQVPAAVKFDQPVTVSFWHPQPTTTGQALQALVDKFNATNDKRITVQAEFQGQSSTSADYTFLHQKNMAALSAGTPTDFSVAYENMVADYMRGNGCVNFDDYIKDKTLGLSKESFEDIFPAYLEGLRFPQYGNQLLSFPFTKSLVVMYVNEELLQRANVKGIPKTWDEFAAAIQQVSRNDASLVVDPNLGAVADPNRRRTYGWGNYASASTINAWAYSRGGTMLTADNKQVRFTEVPFLESFQLTEEAFKRGHAYNPPRGANEIDFASNRMAFIMQSSTGRPFFQRTMKDNGRENMAWRIANIPQKDPSKPATVMYGGNIAIFRTTPIKQAASWAFIKWFTERDQNVEWSIVSGYMPVRRSAAESPRLKAHWEKDDPRGKDAFEINRHAKLEPNVRGAQEIRPVIQKALQAVMDGKTTSKAALEEAAREANLILQQNA
ncbi:MAG: extracellular solute-binding protein [Chloroflexi bacterium]|nr:extracellular solute-binding protein [Chloroflexota bacterium]